MRALIRFGFGMRPSFTMMSNSDGEIPMYAAAATFVSEPSHNAISCTDPLVQVDYVRVVDLDIGASKSDI